jgi:hypothetical protein
MTTRALGPGPATRRRAFFGLLDADGWGWASIKAFFWFILIIFILGYIPDRAYYLTVNRTVDLGILAWSPVNLCPAENRTLPCPAPVGAVRPWEESPAELALPQPRSDGALVQVGTQLLHIGGTDGTAASNAVFVARTVPVGNFDRWTEGPALPEPRTDFAVASLNGVIYLVGGSDAEGAPAASTYVLRPNLETGDLGEWQAADADEAPAPDLPEPRTGGALVALADGLLLVGGAGADGVPTTTTWKSELDAEGALGEWTPQAALSEPSADAIAVLNGDFVWLYGGRNAGGPTVTVQRGDVSTATGDMLGDLTRWATGAAPNLPEGRVDGAGWAANGAMYLAGGRDADSTETELYWATPVAGGDGDTFPEWKRLPESDLPGEGRAGAGVTTSGPNVFLVGGRAGDAVQASAVRANLAPEEPFFQLGLVGVVVPGLQIPGEIGQQLGQLNAAGIATVNFVILILIGWAFANRDRTAAWFRRFRDRRRRRRA